MKLITDSANDFWALLYYNKNDPKFFVYKSSKYKWLGITFNFAHAKAWYIFLFYVTLPLVLIWIFCVVFLPRFGKAMAINGTLYNEERLVDNATCLALFVVLLLFWMSLIIYSFRMAALNAKNHPSNETNQSP